MIDYKPIAAQLARVRRAWKRTSALVGLAVTILETMGMFTVVLLVDLLFRPGIEGRLVLLGLVLAGAVVLLVRHVLRPLLRHLPDEQIALYIEEYNPVFEGALIAAAEFGRQDENAGGAALVSTILHEAERRAGRLDLRSVSRRLRLRKYAWSAAAVLVAYGAASVFFPQTVGWHAARVIAPWKVPDPKPAPAPGAVRVKSAIEFQLSTTNADVMRGTTFRMESSLSRDSDSPVQLHFHSCDETATESRWYVSPMQTLEKVRAYEGVLPDINEDMECYVSAERFRSESCRLHVYDPLAVESVETVIHYPAYLELPDSVDRRPAGDVAAPDGSVVTLRVMANRLLVRGRLDWADGTAQEMTPLTNAPHVAAVAFSVTTNRAYRFRVEDAMGQVVESPSETFVKVLPDSPPTLVLKRPAPPLPASVTPLSELTVEAVVSDDFGVAGVDLVYRCGGETEGAEQRIPLTLESGAGTFGAEVPASVLFQMESIVPRLRGGEAIAWYLEVRDRKQQTAVSDLILTPVRYLDAWSVELWHAHEHDEEDPPSLPAILQGVFQLAARRERMAPREVETQSEDLAQTMMDAATGKVWLFARATQDTKPEDRPKISRANALARKGHDELMAHRPEAAIEPLRRAVMIMISLGLLEELPVLQVKPIEGPGLPGTEQNETQIEQQLAALTAIERQAERQKQTAPKPPPTAQAEKTEALAKNLEKLAHAQAENVDRAHELERRAAEAEARAVQPQQERAREQAASNQQTLAETVRQAADEVAREQALNAEQRLRTAEQMREAARHMSAAAVEMNQGRLERAADEAEDARRRLAAALAELQTADQEQLARALARAESLAAQTLRRQQDVSGSTAAAAARAKSEPPKTERLERDMKALAMQQVCVKTDLERLQASVAALMHAVENGRVRPETATHIRNAEQELRRGRAAQKAVKAVVAMTALRPADALAEQKKAAETIEKAHASLRQASDSMATGFDAELKRVRNEAAQAEQALAELKKPRAPSAAGAAEARSATAEDAVETASRLARHVQARDFVSAPTLKSLQDQVRRAVAPGARLDEDKDTAVALSAAVGKVRVELDEVYAKLQKNRKLFSSQREECPPQYRSLVNKYFETLSGEGQ